MGSPDSLGNHKPILILFDGVCNLCNGLVQFIIRRDPKGKFKFASLQSDVGRSLLTQFNIDSDLLHSYCCRRQRHGFSTKRCSFAHCKIFRRRVENIDGV